jgi:hypothetical protein
MATWLAIWERRREPDAHARRCANDAVDAIDAIDAGPAHPTAAAHQRGPPGRRCPPARGWCTVTRERPASQRAFARSDPLRSAPPVSGCRVVHAQLNWWHAGSAGDAQTELGLPVRPRVPAPLTRPRLDLSQRPSPGSGGRPGLLHAGALVRAAARRADRLRWEDVDFMNGERTGILNPSYSMPHPSHPYLGNPVLRSVFAGQVRWGGWGSNPRPADYEKYGFVHHAR